MCVVWKGACFIYSKACAWCLCRVPHSYSDIRQSGAPFRTPFFPPRTLQISLLISQFFSFLSPWLVRLSLHIITGPWSLFHFSAHFPFLVISLFFVFLLFPLPITSVSPPLHFPWCFPLSPRVFPPPGFFLPFYFPEMWRLKWHAQLELQLNCRFI